MPRKSKENEYVSMLEAFLGKCESHYHLTNEVKFPVKEDTNSVNLKMLARDSGVPRQRIYDSQALKTLVNEACEYYGVQGLVDQNKKNPLGDKQIEQKIQDARTNSAKDRAAALQSNALYESVHIANLELTEENAKLKNLVKTLRARIEQYESGVFGGVNE